MLPSSSFLIVAACVSTVWLAGCENNSPPSPAAQPATAVASSKATARAATAKLVFLDKEDACACTQAKIDAAWAAIQSAVPQDSPLPIERIHMDTQPDEARAFTSKRAAIALPALYVLDEQSNIIDLLQGDIDEASVRRVVN